METVEDVVTLPADVKEKMDRVFQRAVDQANSLAVSRASHVQRWLILPRDFSVGGGELGPTLKCGGALCSRCTSDRSRRSTCDSMLLLLHSEHTLHSFNAPHPSNISFNFLHPPLLSSTAFHYSFICTFLSCSVLYIASSFPMLS